ACARDTAKPPVHLRRRRTGIRGIARWARPPRLNRAAAPPHLSDVRQIEVVLIMFRVAQRRRLGVGFLVLLAHVGGAQHAQSLRIGCHKAVLDAVMNHFDEVAGAVWTAVQITLLGGAGGFFTPRRARNIAGAGSQGRKDWIKVLDDLSFAANHHAVTALQSPNPTARSDVYIMDALGREFLGA